jgi:bifunctional aspartokinase / homoserine dehydrogenase 1
MAPAPTVSVIVIGAGGVGGALVDQLLAQHDSLLALTGVDLRVSAVARSSKMLAAPALRTWRDALDASTSATDLPSILNGMQSSSAGSVVCDCTASDAISALYAVWLRAGLHVVTANKRAASGPIAGYVEIMEAARSSGALFLCEANVGAGLPIIDSLRNMVRTGDKILEISGCLSGTLSYIFSSFDGSEPFSAVVARAKNLSYTEPDPRDDLSGTDVARKVVILAREIGIEVELADVPVQSLVPIALQGPDVSVSDFMAWLPGYDADLGELAAHAASAGEVLRYVGVIDAVACTCAVELRGYKSTHPFGALRGSDNLVSLRSKRYDAQPLVIRGPGAGNDVTAAGVFTDVLRVVAGLSSGRINQTR